MAPSSFGAWVLVVLAVASALALAEQVLVASPTSVSVDATDRRTHERSVQLGNSGSQSLVVDLSIRLADQRRLDGGQQLEDTPHRIQEEFGNKTSPGGSSAASAVGAPAATAQGDVSTAATPQRSLTSTGESSAECSGLQRLLFRVRAPPGHASSIPSSRRLSSQRLARRLQEEVEGMNGSSWKHLAALGIDIAELDCKSMSTPEQVLAEVQRGYGKELEFAELDKHNIFPFSDFPGTRDPHWSNQWGMHRIKAEEAWTVLQHRMAGAQSTVVAVLDTGVDVQHLDLQGHIWTNPGEIPGNGVDDDNNGLVDDVHGWDYADNDNDPSDSDGHGTHCAGVIAASAGNGMGIEGVAGHINQVKVMALRFLGPNGGLISDAVLALNYAVAMGAQISSNSWGSTSYSTALNSAIQMANQAGHAFVAAAGNDGSSNDITPQYPCCYASVLCVAATTSSNQLASYSNYGQVVDIAAPGSGIFSTWPQDQLHYLSGTSMATPHVSGAVALLWSTLGGQLGMQLKEVVAIAKETASQQTWLQGKVNSGLLDVYAMAIRVENQAWMHFVPLSGDTSQGLSELAVTIPPSSSASFTLRIDPGTREEGDYEATVLASCEACGPELEIPVVYRLAGVPDVGDDLHEAALNWGAVPVNAQSKKTLSITNRGNGAAMLKLEHVATPFSGPTELVTILPQATVHLEFLCSPASVGSWEREAIIRTNEGLEGFAGREPDAWLHGTAFPLSLTCSGREAPNLELDAFSGVQLWPEKGPMRHIEPSIPAEWESLVVDPTDPAAHVTGRLLLADASNLEGCHAHSGAVKDTVVLVMRGTCSFQQKAEEIAQAGGVGMIVWDNVDVTGPLKMMALAHPDSPPSLPSFLVTRKEGLDLKERLLQGEVLHVSLVRRPLVLITHHPLHGMKHYGLGQLSVRNPGEMELHWRAGFAPFSYDWDSFYGAIYEGAPSDNTEAPLPPPPEFDWTAEHTLGEIPHFAGHYVDDAAAKIELPFNFPFYNASYEAANVNTNGFLSLDPHYSPGLDHTGHLGSMFAPNGLIAPFWTDLVCRSSWGCKIRAGSVATGRSGDGSCESSSAMVVQYKDTQHYQLAPYQKASFETRLYSTGCIEMMYKELPAASCIASVGVETVDGQHGMDLAHKLSLRSAHAMAVQLVPWLTPRGPVEQTSPPGGHATLDFAVEGSKSRQGWITVTGEQEGSSWSLERNTRVVQRIFGYSWHIGPWDLCRRPTCEPSDSGTQTRSVSCKGTDGEVYDESKCGVSQVCMDDPLGWRDWYGDSCRKYKRKAYCTPSGGYGHGWYWFWGTFEDYANDGHIAPTACCACGGGTVTSSRPEEVRGCSPTEAGPDADGDGYDDCVDRTSGTSTTMTTTMTSTLTATSSATSTTSSSVSRTTTTSTTSTTTASTATMTGTTTLTSSTATTMTTTATTITQTATSTSSTTSTTTTSSATSTTATVTTATSVTLTSTTTTMTTSGTTTSTTTTTTRTATTTGTTITNTATATTSTWSSTVTTETTTVTSTTTSGTTATQTLTITTTTATTATTTVSSTTTSITTGTTPTTITITTATVTSTTSSSSRTTATATTTTKTATVTTSTTTATTTTSSTMTTKTITATTTTDTTTVTSTTMTTVTVTSTTATATTTTITTITQTATATTTTVTLTATTVTTTATATTTTITITTQTSTATTTTLTETATTVTTTTTATTQTSTATATTATVTVTTATITATATTTTITTTTQTSTATTVTTQTLTATTTTTTVTVTTVTTTATATTTTISTTTQTSTATTTTVTETVTTVTTTITITTTSQTSTATSTTATSTATTVTITTTATTATATTTTQTSTATTTTQTETATTVTTTTTATTETSTATSTTTTVTATTMTTTTATSTTTITTTTITTATQTSTATTTTVTVTATTSTTTATDTTTTITTTTQTSTATTTTVTETVTSVTTTDTTTMTTTTPTSTATTTTETVTVTTVTSTATSTTTTHTTTVTTTTATTLTTITHTTTTTTTTWTSTGTTLTTRTVSTTTTTTTSVTTTTSSSTSSATTLSSTTSTTATTLTTTTTATTTTTSATTRTSTTSTTETTTATTGTTSTTSSATQTSTTLSSVTSTTTTVTTVTVTTLTLTTTITTTTVTTVTVTTITSTATTTTVTTTLGALFPIDPDTGEVVQVDSISAPTNTNVAKSSVLVVGPTEPSEVLQTGLEQVLAGELGVGEDQVTVTDFKVTKAALLDSAGTDGTRRLDGQPGNQAEEDARKLSSLQDALQADVEVAVAADPTTTGFQSIDEVLASLQAVKSNPSSLVDSFNAMLDRENVVLPQPLRMRVATPTVQESSARLVVSKWRACGADVEVCVPSEPAMRSREIICVAADDLYKQLKPFRCSGSVAPRSEEPCPSGLPRPPPCGWSTSGWSDCRPRDTPPGSSCPPGGTGIQEREVTCLVEGSFSACTDTPPDTTQDCTCLDTRLGEQTEEGPPVETSVLVSEGGANTVGMASAGAGALLFAALGGGLWFSCTRRRGSKSKVYGSKLDGSTPLPDLVMEDFVSMTLAATGAPDAANLVQQPGLKAALSPQTSPRVPRVVQAPGYSARLEAAGEGITRSSASEVPSQWRGSNQAPAAPAAKEVQDHHSPPGDRFGTIVSPSHVAVCQASPTSTQSTWTGSPASSSSVPSPAGSVSTSGQERSAVTPTASLGKAWSPPVVLAGHVQPQRHISSPFKTSSGTRRVAASSVAASRVAWQDQRGSTSALGAASPTRPAQSAAVTTQSPATHLSRPQGRGENGVRVAPA